MTSQNFTDEWPKWAKAFLKSLSLTGNITKASQAAKIDRRTVYYLRESDDAFLKAWDDAIEEAADLLEEEARRRAYDGVDKPVVNNGEIVSCWMKNGKIVPARTKGSKRVPLILRQYSDPLLTLLLKACKPEKFRDRHEIGGIAGQPIEQKHSGNVTTTVVQRWANLEDALVDAASREKAGTVPDDDSGKPVDT